LRVKTLEECFDYLCEARTNTRTSAGGRGKRYDRMPTSKHCTLTFQDAMVASDITW
jgi:hypothetical protein